MYVKLPRLDHTHKYNKYNKHLPSYELTHRAGSQINAGSRGGGRPERGGGTSNGLASHPEGVEIPQNDSSFEGIRTNEKLQRDFTLLLFTQGKFKIVFNNLCLYLALYSNNFNKELVINNIFI